MTGRFIASIIPASRRRWKRRCIAALRVRLLVDGNKYKESRTTQELLTGAIIPFRLGFGRQGRGSKMHHKFVILDQQTVLTGSYNWTHESEEENHENLLILRDPRPVEAYTREFEALWSGAGRAIRNSFGKHL